MRLPPFSLLLLFSLLSAGIYGQAFRGRVVDRSTDEPLGFTTFLRLAEGQSPKGFTADVDGYYFISIDWRDGDTLAVSQIGFLDTMVTVEDLRISPRLTLERDADLPVVEVRAKDEYFGGSLSKLSADVENISFQPQLAGESDILKGLTIYPGITTGLEGTAELIFRGGNPNQTDVSIDGISLLNVAHIGGFLSALPSFGLKSLTVYKSGAPGRYGNRLSGVIDARYRRGTKNSVRQELTIGTGLLRVGLEGGIGQGSGYLVSGRLSYPTLLLGALNNVDQFESGSGDQFVFGDFLAKISTKFSEWDTEFTVFLSGDQGYSQLESLAFVNTEAYRWTNALASLKTSRSISKRLRLEVLLGGLRYAQAFRTYDLAKEDEQVNFDLNDESNYRRYTGTFQLIQHLRSTRKFTYGLQVNHTRNENNRMNRAIDANLALLTQRGINIGAFVMTDFDLNRGRTQLTGTARADYYENTEQAIQPQLRLLLSHRLAPRLFLNLGGERNVQAEQQLQTQATLFSSNFLLLPDSFVKPAKVIHAHGGLAGSSGGEGRLTWSVEAYYKRFSDLTRVRPGRENDTDLLQDISSRNYATGGRGESYGMEVYGKHRIGKMDYSLSYTISKSTRTYDLLNGGRPFPFTFDRRHDLTFQPTFRLGEEWTIYLDFTYQSGSAITVPSYVTSDFFVYQDLNNARFPDFHRLNIGFTKSWKPKRHPKWRKILTFSLYNAYNRRNAYYVDVTPTRTEGVDPTTGNPVIIAGRNVTTSSLFGILPGLSYQIHFNR